MDLRVFLTVFATVFIAELGDKTQIATMLFATDKEAGKLTIFLAASSALILASALGVIAGSVFSGFINEKALQYVAGAGFMLIGAYTIYSA